MKGKFHNITFVNACACTEDTEDEIVDEFYKTLQSVCNELPKHDATITLGHFNAKLGKEQMYTRVGTSIVATIYLQLIQNRYMF